MKLFLNCLNNGGMDFNISRSMINTIDSIVSQYFISLIIYFIKLCLFIFKKINYEYVYIIINMYITYININDLV